MRVKITPAAAYRSGHMSVDGPVVLQRRRSAQVPLAACCDVLMATGAHDYPLLVAKDYERGIAVRAGEPAP